MVCDCSIVLGALYFSFDWAEREQGVFRELPRLICNNKRLSLAISQRYKPFPRGVNLLPVSAGTGSATRALYNAPPLGKAEIASLESPLLVAQYTAFGLASGGSEKSESIVADGRAWVHWLLGGMEQEHFRSAHLPWSPRRQLSALVWSHDSQYCRRPLPALCGEREHNGAATTTRRASLRSVGKLVPAHSLRRSGGFALPHARQHLSSNDFYPLWH